MYHAQEKHNSHRYFPVLDNNTKSSKSSTLLSILTLSLSESALSNALVHRFVLPENKLAHSPRNRSQEPGHDTMTPVGRRAVSVGR